MSQNQRWESSHKLSSVWQQEGDPQSVPHHHVNNNDTIQKQASQTRPSFDDNETPGTVLKEISEWIQSQQLHEQLSRTSEGDALDSSSHLSLSSSSLSASPAFHDFVAAFRQLVTEQRQEHAMDGIKPKTPQQQQPPPPQNQQAQHDHTEPTQEDQGRTLVVTTKCTPPTNPVVQWKDELEDHLWLGIFQWLNAHELARSILPTCRAWRRLVYQHVASIRRRRRQHCLERFGGGTPVLSSPSISSSTRAWAILSSPLSPLQWLRALEQVQGLWSHESSRGIPRIPIPTLLLPHAICVSYAGDEDYNGIYHCTSCHANGFVFTKPRRRRPRLRHQHNHHDKVLQCCIARRFSHQTMIWYMSKELAPDEVPNHSRYNDEDGETRTVVVVQEEEEDIPDTVACCAPLENHHPHSRRRRIRYQQYAFWAPLLQSPTRVANDDENNNNDDNHQQQQYRETARIPSVCFYPSPTCLLQQQHNSGGWQSLRTTQHWHPPTVEILISHTVGKSTT